MGGPCVIVGPDFSILAFPSNHLGISFITGDDATPTVSTPHVFSDPVLVDSDFPNLALPSNYLGISFITGDDTTPTVFYPPPTFSQILFSRIRTFGIW